MKFKIAFALLASVALISCGKSNEVADEKKPATISDAISKEAVEKAQASAMPKGDPAKPLAEYRSISGGNDLMFLYHGLLNMPIDYEKIAEVYLDSYRYTNDAFKKQDMLKAIKPRIDQAIEAAKNSRYIVWEISSPYRSALNSYDMGSQSFTIKDLSSSGYFYWNDNASSYHLQFTNAEQMAALKVTDESKARAIESMVSSNQAMKVKLYAFVQDADPSTKNIKAEILHVTVSSKNGQIYP